MNLRLFLLGAGNNSNYFHTPLESPYFKAIQEMLLNHQYSVPSIISGLAVPVFLNKVLIF